MEVWFKGVPTYQPIMDIYGEEEVCLSSCTSMYRESLSLGKMRNFEGPRMAPSGTPVTMCTAMRNFLNCLWKILYHLPSGSFYGNNYLRTMLEIKEVLGWNLAEHPTVRMFYPGCIYTYNDTSRGAGGTTLNSLSGSCVPS